MEVNIYRKAVEELLQAGFPENTAVISFYDPPSSKRAILPPVDYSGRASYVFQVAIYAIDLIVLPQYSLTYDTYFTEVDDLAEFIYTAEADELNIICQCEYGKSSGSACAAAILEHFCRTRISIFADYRYYPNQVVYHKVLGALEKFQTHQKG